MDSSYSVSRHAVTESFFVPGFLDGLRASLKDGSFRPLPVRERTIPKPGGSGKVRRLGIPTVADRVVQAALKLVLEPIFEADSLPVSYGFRPMRRAHDAIAEIQYFGTKGYRWVLDADIEACFDSISHSALLERVRARVKDKRVLALVKGSSRPGYSPNSACGRPPTPAHRKGVCCLRCCLRLVRAR
jgi:RNA-directed DNA polymerase